MEIGKKKSIVSLDVAIVSHALWLGIEDVENRLKQSFRNIKP